MKKKKSTKAISKKTQQSILNKLLPGMLPIFSEKDRIKLEKKYGISIPEDVIGIYPPDATSKMVLSKEDAISKTLMEKEKDKEIPDGLEQEIS